MEYESELYHHGIKGQKWGVRRSKNRNGKRTSSRASNGKAKKTKPKSTIDKSKVASYALLAANFAALAAGSVGAVSQLSNISDGLAFANRMAFDRNQMAWMELGGDINGRASNHLISNYEETINYYR